MIITSHLFKQFPNLVFGMSTKQLENPEIHALHAQGDLEGRRQTMAELCTSLGITKKSVAHSDLTHGNDVKIVSEPGHHGETDAMITQTPGVFLSMKTADCIPIFLFNPEIKTVAVIHAGRKGLLKHIIKETIESLKKNLSVNPKNISVFVGPCIEASCYGISQERAESFPSQYSQKKGEHYFLDLKKMAVDQLLHEGILERNIEISPLCTFCAADTLYSYRKAQNNTGRNIGVIGMRNEEGGMRNEEGEIKRITHK